MFRKRLSLLAGLGLAAGLVLGASRVAAEIQPSSDILLPYFEVDLTSFGRNTLFSVANSAGAPVDFTVNVYTNWGIPLLEVPVSLRADQVLTVSLRDWLGFGQLPTRVLSAGELGHVQAALTGRPSPRDGAYYGTAVEQPNRAVGYVLVRSTGQIRPDALWGDYFLTDADLVYLSGDTLVNLDPTVEALGTCERHLVRFLEGGGFSAGTEVYVWTGMTGRPSATPLFPDSPVLVTAKAYDEQGKELGQHQARMLSTQMVRTSEMMGVDNAFGWLDVRTVNPSFVGVRFTSRALATTAFRSYCAPTAASTNPGAAIMVGLLTNGIHADVPPGPMLTVGSPITWEYFVQNLGNVRLRGVTVADDPVVRVVCPKNVLNPGESMVCSASGVALGCQFKNVAVATGTAPSGEQVTAEDVGYYYGDEAAALSLLVKVEGQAAGTSPGPAVPTGATVHLTYEVTNPGKAALTGITVADDQAVSVHCPGSALNPGQSMVCTGTETARGGIHVHRVAVQGNPPCGEALSAQAMAYHNGPLPAIRLKTLVNGDDADLAPGPMVATGGPLCWSFVVTNTGDATLTQVQVTDDHVWVSCPRTALSAGEAMTCIGMDMAAAGAHTDTATASGIAVGGAMVSARDAAHYFGKAIGTQGCPTNYWRQEPDSWTMTSYGPMMSLTSVFPAVSLYPAYANGTLLDALNFGDGPGVAGAAGTLLRAGVTALVNAGHPGIAYPRTALQVMAAVENALVGGDRTAMLALAASLDNDSGMSCPL